MVFVHNAGFGGMGGVSRLTRHKEIPPPFLGDEEEIDQEGEYEEEGGGGHVIEREGYHAWPRGS